MDISPAQTRRDQLRHATADAHARIDAVLSGGLAHRVAYGHYLRGMHRFVCESAQALASDTGAAAVVRARGCLEADLHLLALAPLPAPPVAVLHALPERLGWHYVVAGSSLGARFLLRDVLALGLEPTHGASFLAHHAASRDWTDFLARLEQAPLSPQDLPRIGAAARHAFAAAHAAMLAARQEQTE